MGDSSLVYALISALAFVVALQDYANTRAHKRLKAEIEDLRAKVSGKK